MNIEHSRALLSCPACYGSLQWKPESCRCGSCYRDYTVKDGIPVLVAAAHAGEDELGHHHDHHKGAQAGYYDQHRAAEFEIARPNNAPRLYEWLMREKFRRSMSGLAALQTGATGTVALTVCGGSGMEAQFLAESGFDVIASDISLGAAQRCRERARRFGLRILSIVADVEHLPFADRTVPLVYVHDGLHHLADPDKGLEEMGRVAAEAISITEPARAALTAIAVRFGLALAYEAPGNRVARLSKSQVEIALGRLGFDAVRSRRYAMYYRHHPGRAMKVLSHPRLMPIASGTLRAINLAGGRWGNKLAVNGVRRAATAPEEN